MIKLSQKLIDWLQIKVPRKPFRIAIYAALCIVLTAIIALCGYYFGIWNVLKAIIGFLI
jgi:hypothetical protein